MNTPSRLCPQCGTLLAPNATFCSNCGRPYSEPSPIPPTQYASPSSPIPPIQYASPPASDPYSSSPYEVSSPPPANPYESSLYGASSSSSTAPPPPLRAPPSTQPQKKSRRGLWITLGVIGGVLVLGFILLVVIGANVSTPTKTLQTYCGALKQRDYQTAYNQLSQGQHSLQSESQFAAQFKSGLTDCLVSNVDDSAGTGTVTYVGSNGSAAADEILVDENGTWKINKEKAR